MTSEFAEVRKRILALSDDELLKLVHVESADYRPDALGAAKEELRRRGLPTTPPPGKSPAATQPPSWTCCKCKENIEGSLQVCWNCGTSVDGVEDLHFQPLGESGRKRKPASVGNDEEQTAATSPYPVVFEVFRGGALTSWEALFEEAAAFASQIPPDRLISISHSAEASEGVVTVWYRDGSPELNAG